MSDDYEVGYGRPPKHTRFRKGKSGNPKGRPKGRRNHWTEVAAILKAPVVVKENGRRKSVTTERAALLRLREKALAGDARALRMILDLARDYTERDEVSPAIQAVSENDQAIIDRYFAEMLEGDDD